MDELLNNSMLDIARKALTPEQEEEYRKIGQYMFSDEKLRLVQETSKPVETKDILFYAQESIKAGLHPRDLSKEELDAMRSTYGDEWYTRFGLHKDDVPQSMISVDIKPPKRRKTAAQKWKAKRQIFKQ